MMGKPCIIPGTRPEIIKMSPVVRACERRGADWFVVHTGQHYSHHMDRVFFGELELPDAKYNPDVGSGSEGHGEQTGRMMAGIEKAKRTLDCRPQMKFEYEFENAHWVVCLELGG